MEKAKWKVEIKSAAQAAGTYQPFFDSIIDTLSGILERRDLAQEEFEASGSEILVEYKKTNGAEGRKANPLLVMINELNRDALAYWRDLGLTPAGLKKINENALTRKRSTLAEVLTSLES